MTHQPENTIKGITFIPVPEFTENEIAFGAGLEHYFPRNDVPEVPSKYEKQASELFFNGGKIPKFKKEVDPEKAQLALRAWLSSWAPAHEVKTATVGYALWVWQYK